MYNPYFNPQGNIDRINNQIKELESLKTQFQNPPMQPQSMQQPITQNFQLASNQTTIDFEAKYIKDNEDISNIPINRRTAFIDLNKGMLSIKEVDGDVKEYPIILPKDEKDLKIEELEKKLSEMEMKLNANTQPIQPTNEIKRQTSNDTKSNITKSTK